MKNLLYTALAAFPPLLLAGMAAGLRASDGAPPVASAASVPSPAPIAAKPAVPLVSLQNDVIPVMTKIGCNGASCHGQQNGQGGFKLSLRGWDAKFDWEQMVQAEKGKRVSKNFPTKSLLLQKPSGGVPHGGGVVLPKDSPSYNLILRWVKNGMTAPSDKEAQIVGLSVTPDGERVLPKPGASLLLRVTARYSDKTQRDVTSLARYQMQNDAVAVVDGVGKVVAKGAGETSILVSYGGEVRTANVLVPFVTPKPAVAPVANGKAIPKKPVGLVSATPVNYIDELAGRKIMALRLSVSPRTSDSEFLRRAYLDTIATLPTPEETRAFLSDPAPNKRAKLIDALLERPEYTDYRALKLADLLRINGQYVGEEGADTYYRWVRDQVQRNVPYDRFTRDLLTARGSTFRTGPANYFRVARTPEDLAEATAQTFLGTRIACAKCHNHPFENWKQRDYYGMAAFFARFGSKSGPEFGEEQVFVRRTGDVQNPRTKETIKPRFLVAATVTGAEPNVPDDADRRTALADWLTSPKNLPFARVAVNRIWADYFGRGIVDPIDDFRISNPPSNAPLLDALAKDFIAHKFDTKYIARVILNSETYQRSSEILPGNVLDDRYFARAYPRRLPAEALMDAVGQITGKPERFYPYPQGWRATQLRNSQTSAYFLEVFGRPKREILCACERSPQPNLAQSLHLINSDGLNSKIAATDGRLEKLLKRFESWAPAARDKRVIEEMYMMALCRPPSKTESAAMLAYVGKSKERRKGFEDALWALLNSEEFLFNK